MAKRFFLFSLCFSAALVGLPFYAGAAEPAWLGAEYVGPDGRAHRLVSDAREAATLDQPGSGWRRTGAIFHAHVFVDSEFDVPVCRVARDGVAGFAVGAALCADYAGYTPQSGPAANVFFVAKASAGGLCARGEPVWLLRDPSNGQLAARIGQGEPVPGMGIAKSELVWGLCAPKTARMRRMEAARLLDQASFGATPAAIDAIADGVGIRQWIAQQLDMPATRYTQYPTYFRPVGFFDINCTYSLADGTPAGSEVQKCARETFSPELVQREFFWQATEGADQLRQRVAWAWSQLFVVSNMKEGMAYGMADYQQGLRDLAFGRFEDLLYMVATHPMMGRMLDNDGNAKAQGLRQPSENFARELLQLFTTGTVKLKPDGSPMPDANGLPVPLYGQDTITEMARAVTGWVQAPSTPPAGRMPGNLRDPMVPNANNHDTGAKSLFGGELVIPAGMDAASEMRRVVQFLTSHPNTAVHISRFLIQRLVTSNPSPAYLERVVGTFRNNGNGVVGDLRAVVMAILLDPEARGALRPEEDYGRMRDIVQRYVGMLRAVNARGFKGQEVQLPWSMFSSPFNAPSVFGFFLANHEIAPGLYGPEFNANRASMVLDWAGLSSLLAAVDIQGRNWTPPVAGTSDVSGLMAMSGDVGRLVDHLNLTYTAGSMSGASVSALSDILGSFRPWGGNQPSPEMLARTALFLVFNSSQYHVQR